MEHGKFFPFVTMSLIAAALVVAPGCAKSDSHEHAFMGGPDCTNPDRGFMPESKQRFSVNARVRSNMTEAQFNTILDKIDAVYRPVISGLGGQLTIERRWTDDTVNAYAERIGNQYIIRMFGGMARHPRITADGFAIVACHEMGHHLGGAPHYGGQILANEGQSDYFSTLKCFRRVFGGENNAQIVSGMNVDPLARSKCEKNFGTAAEIATCVRASMAGQAAAFVTNSSPTDPAFGTPDPSIVGATQDGHPLSQCRLDTYFGGAVCQVGMNEALSDTDPTVGTCSVEKGWKEGLRPQCWYKPSSGSNPDPDPNTNPIPIPTPSGLTPAPLVMNQSMVTISNPGTAVVISYNVSSVPGAGGIYIEVSRPNMIFVEPNSMNPDPYALMNQSIHSVSGSLTIVPLQNLPSWGSYQIRVIALDSTGQNAVAKFSNAAVLNVFPRSGRPRGQMATGF